MFQRGRFRKFQVRENGFVCKDRFHTFDEIEHIFLDRVIMTQWTNLVKGGEPEFARVILTLDTGEKIKLSFDEGTIVKGFYLNRKKEIGDLLDLYLLLSQKTFEKRISPYISQVEQKGYFVYDGCCFYPRDKVVFRNREFYVSSCRFLKGPGYVEVRKKDFGFADKVKRRVFREVAPSRIPRFDIQTDTDVILALLDCYFGVTWKS